MVWGVARAEARLCRRLVRYWVFQSLATIIGFAMFMYYWGMHYAWSSLSGTIAMLNPRYLIAVVGIYYTVAFLLGLVFLGYDVRARDSRERMSEVLDALPCTNLELVLGKYLGIILPCWIPVLIITVGLGALSAALGQPIEPRSLFSFAFLLILPSYFLVLGLTFLMTLLLRHRLVSAVAVIGILVGIVVINFGFIPIYLMPTVDITGGFSIPWPSNIVPMITDLQGGLQRLAVVLAGLALLWFSAAMHPRKDDSSRAVTAGVGGVMLIVAAAIIGGLVWDVKSIIAEKAVWKEAHTARSEDPAPDLLTISGDLDLRPGNGLAMDLEMRFRAPLGSGLDSALFSLNPGLVVTSARAGGEELQFEHDNGLLDIRLPRRLAPGEQATIELAVDGEPDLWFGYLDAAFDPLTINMRDGNVFMLGFLNYVDDRRFVALMPGVRWLPASGADIGRGDPDIRPADFFTLDLTVELPEGWLVAGPGRRQDVDEEAAGGRVRYRFAPPAPVPEVALIAGEYESRATEVEGVTMEVMLHPSHVEAVDYFADAGVEVENWLKERMEEAAGLGLYYPYDGLTVVEVPGMLRGYGGGWRMDSTMIQPALILVRESGFPTANFESRFKNPRQFEDREGGLPRAKRQALSRFFENDFTGGNPFVAASRSFFGYQTAGAGEEGLSLDFVYENLSTELVTEKTGYFSVHMMGEDMNQAIGRSLRVIGQRRGGRDMADAIIHAVASRSEVWDEVLGVSLAEMDPWEDPQRTVDVLTLKGGGMARSMLDDLGREKTGSLLADLRERRGGETFAREDVLLAGENIGEDLEPWLDVWIHQTELPGFVLGDVEAHRITDSEDGAPNYQVLVTVRNEEPAPGMLRLEYFAGRERGSGDRGESEPIHVGAHSSVEIGLVMSAPPRRVHVMPYLALNRDGFDAHVPAIDEENKVEAEPFTGVRDSDWTPPSDVIVVDDLDEGFSVEESASRGLWRFGGRGGDEDLDSGLPLLQRGPRSATRWSRWVRSSAHGKYRHTAAVVRAGKGGNRAIFSADIPEAGQWELEYYLLRRPGRGGGGRGSPGTWNLTIADDSDSREVEFKADEADAGWNSLGEFDIGEGEVRVEVSDETDGAYVVADAIRWVPSD
jgi:ABC-type transport system involved in multi-copper enzyme maturation permease subunit